MSASFILIWDIYRISQIIFIVSPLIIYCLPAYFNFTIPKFKKIDNIIIKAV